MRLLTLLLLPILALGCTSANEMSDPDGSLNDRPCLTCEGRVLMYTVGAGQQQYPFVATMTQNDEEGLGFDYDLGNGNQMGSVLMTAQARAGAMGFMNQFGSAAYTLTDRTSVFLSQAAFRAAKDAGAVAIDFGGNDGSATMQLADCVDGGFLTSVEGASADYPVCTLEGPGGKRLTVLDDDMNPLILSMNTGSFEVSLNGAE